MASDFNIRANDRLPPIIATLKDAAGAVVDLSPVGTTVKFQMVDAASFAIKVNATAAITNGAGGIVQYDWLAADTDTAGNYLATWEVTWPSGKKQTFPTAANLTINVFGDLA